MKKYWSLKSISVLALVLILSSCSYTKLTSSWFNIDAPAKHYKKIGEVALTPDKANRGLIENSLVAVLKENNINAVNTLGVFPKAGNLAGQEIDKEAMEATIQKKVNSRGIDALIIVALLDVKEDQYYVEGESTDYTSPYYSGGIGYGGRGYGYGAPGGSGYGYPLNNYPSYNRGGLYGYYSYAHTTVYDPGYYVNTTSYFMETSIFDVKTEEMIWSAQTTTKDPTSIKKEIGTYAELIGKQILHDQILK